MGRRLRLEDLAPQLPVAWAVPPEDTIDLDLKLGHPGRVSQECVGPDAPCEVGVDLFVRWYRRPSESQVCFSFDDVEVISEEQYATRAARVDRGVPPT